MSGLCDAGCLAAVHTMSCLSPLFGRSGQVKTPSLYRKVSQISQLFVCICVLMMVLDCKVVGPPVDLRLRPFVTVMSGTLSNCSGSLTAERLKVWSQDFIAVSYNCWPAWCMAARSILQTCCLCFDVLCLLFLKCSCTGRNTVEAHTMYRTSLCSIKLDRSATL